MLQIVQSNRLESLADALAQALNAPDAAVLAQQTVIVQERGTARWLSFALAERLGIAANIDYPFPAGSIWAFFARVLPDVPRESPFDPGVMTWRFMRLLQSSKAVRHPRLAHALAGADSKRIYELAQRLATIFDRYLVYRPHWIEAWGQGKRLGLGVDEEWQALLWRDLVAALPSARTHPAERFFAALENSATARATLPRTLHLFAVQALPPMYADIFVRLSRWIEVRFYLLNPCEEYWGDIVRRRDIAALQARNDADNHLEVGNPLLASLGRHGRAFFDSLAETAAEEHSCFAENPQPSLLALLQNDILHLRSESAACDMADESVQVHVCHSAIREVEVLQDRLLGAFERDPTLRPSDVLVLVPRIEDYAPAIDAVFSTAPENRRLPYAIADRPRNDNVLLKSFFQLLHLHESRLEAEEVLALLEQPAIAPRFSLAVADLPLLRQWVRESGTRWGYDEHARERLDLPVTREHSWGAGFDRLLLGYALPAEERKLFDGILPYDEIEGGNAQLVGHLKSFVDRLAAIGQELRQPRTLSSWKEWTEELLARMYAFDETNERHGETIRAAVNAMCFHAQRADFELSVPIEVWRTELERLLEAPPRLDGFVGGGISFAALRASRTVPARFVAVLGLNGGDFPRNPPRLSFDLMELHRQAGDRMLREEDRYALLETLLAARERLYLSYTGRSVRDDDELPPSPVLEEVLQAIRASISAESFAQLQIHHPLQPFSRRYFDGSDPRLFSYAADYAAASRSAQSARSMPAFFPAEEALPFVPSEDIYSLQALQDFLRHPAKFFLTRRLDLRLEEQEDLLDIAEPFAPDALRLSMLRRQTLEYLLAGESVETSRALARAAGHLPHGAVGDRVFAEAIAEVQPLHAAILAAGQFERRSFVIERDAFRLNGSLSGIAVSQTVLWHAGHLRADRLLSSWAAHLLVNAAGLMQPTYVYSLDKTRCFQPVANARDELEALCALMQEGLNRPLPFFPQSSHAFAAALNKGIDTAFARAAKGWEGGDFARGERDDAYVALAFRGVENPLTARFAQLASTVFNPLLQALDHD